MNWGRLTAFFFAFVALGLSLVSCSPEKTAEKNGGTNQAPAHLEVEDEKNLAVLMGKYSSAVVPSQPWVGYWWPYTGAGIASAFRDQQKLSPADKYDLAYQEQLKAQGIDVSSGYLSAAAWERSRHGPGLGVVAGWWGHCDGWAAASMMAPEPREPRQINGVTFEVRDQKALLSEAWLEFSSDFIGERVQEAGDTSSAAFWDVVPAQFHLILSNIVAKQGRGLIFDRYTGDQVWNQPLVAFEFDEIKPADNIGAHPDYPNVYRVNVGARIWWANDDVHPDDITPTFDLENYRDKKSDRYFSTRKLRYELWLDGPLVFDENGQLTSSGDILIGRSGSIYVGGVWKNGVDRARLVHSHPDYMWMPFALRSEGYRKNPRIDDGWIRTNLMSAAQ